MSGKSSRQNKEKHAPEPEDSDAVLEASIESLPASDPPGVDAGSRSQRQGCAG